ncbi:unnamed protein product [Musa acuminata subsp. burmannicoides]
MLRTSYMVGIPHRAQKESVVGCFHRSWMGKKKKLVPGLLMQRLEIGVSHGTEA